MKVTTKEILLRQIYKEKIEGYDKAIESQMKIIDMHIQMDYRHNRKAGDYSKLHEIAMTLRRRKHILLRKFNKIDEKINIIAEGT